MPEYGNALTRIVDYSQLYPKEPTAQSILVAKVAGMVAYGSLFWSINPRNHLGWSLEYTTQPEWRSGLQD